jgi:hypothetical protein
MSPRRLRERIALGAVLVGLLGLPALLVLGAGALALSGAGALAFVGVGALALRERDASTPAAPRGVRLATRVAVDEAMLGFMQLRTAVPQLQELSQIAGELETELAHSERIALHAHLAAPPPIDKCELRSESVQELTFESLCFDSGYEPPPGSAGRTRFLSYRANRTAHAALFEVDPRAPWLVCLHGYRMGSPRSNFRLFDPARIARPLGINLAALCLPLHGPRTVGGRSGDRFLFATRVPGPSVCTGFHWARGPPRWWRGWTRGSRGCCWDCRWSMLPRSCGGTARPATCGRLLSAVQRARRWHVCSTLSRHWTTSHASHLSVVRSTPRSRTASCHRIRRGGCTTAGAAPICSGPMVGI